MTIEQLIAQWNNSAEAAQQQPSPVPLEDSAVQVRTGISAGDADILYEGRWVNCTHSIVHTPGCW